VARPARASARRPVEAAEQGEQDTVLRAEPPARCGPIVNVRRSAAFMDSLAPGRATGQGREV